MTLNTVANEMSLERMKKDLVREQCIECLGASQLPREDPYLMPMSPR